MVVLDRFEKTILRILLKNNNQKDRDELIHSFPDDKTKQAYDSLLHLIQLNYLTLKYVGKHCIVVLLKIMEDEAWKIVDPDFVEHKASTPKSEMIPKDYVPEPFHRFYGEKEIHGAVSEYWLSRKKKDKDFVGCFIFNADGTKSSISIGRLSDTNSLASKFLDEIDRLFPDRAFFKHELAHKLPRSLVGNRQPIKAATEYLCLEGYLERIGETSKFRRTNKPHLVDSLDAVVSEQKEPTKSISVGTNGSKPIYYYSDENGLYPNLY